ncbi:uncharacterized protein C4orf54-like [Dunckerocampus dactyliophorus]|uniref:uncharacterized protein C4orf54-like n=1 Tax=Dunckerocampus dactyliophorus TaxID=161453 RepID=UPI002404E06B|nr:uncharacterized protein C4orf54-like [Dunckerocampus dactyliophorus]
MKMEVPALREVTNLLQISDGLDDSEIEGKEMWFPDMEFDLDDEEDEDHFITTHEILLSESSDGASEASWLDADIEDAHQVFSFVHFQGAVVRKEAVSSCESDPQGSAQVHLSIKSTSRGAINDRENHPAKGAGDPPVVGARDRVKGIIPAGKESGEYSSCASSELDDADKEVRSLTAKAFKSLAYPYLEAISFSTSSEESNRWIVSQPPDGDRKIMGNLGQGGVIRLRETLNFRCNVNSGMSNFAPGGEAAGSSSADEVTGSQGGSGKEGQRATVKSQSMEGTHKKAVFASSLIQNVLSKKIQFERERRMERGEVREPKRQGAPKLDGTAAAAEEASKGAALLRSQNSAFRCWRNEEIELQENRKVPEGAPTTPTPPPPAPAPDQDSESKMIKMSHLFVPNIQSVAREKSPEIKINLQGRGPVFTSKGESTSDKVPHFMVRDIRDNKGKLQTPIHQVRDVRKLVKSSYHFVSVDDKSTSATTNPVSGSPVSPMVIKCQSVNTNDSKSSPEGGAKKPAVNNGQEEMTFRIEKKKPELKKSNQVALEKLQAAVKTMEQLYVFDNNEWKRKGEPPSLPQPLTESHVLSLLANEEETRRDSDSDARPKSPTPAGSSSSLRAAPATVAPTAKLFTPKLAASDNYLTIPLKPRQASTGPEPPSRMPTMRPPSPDVPSAAVYPSMLANQVYCFSPAPTLDPFPPTQRKMLLDPTSGSYYLVDTPIQPPTRRLLDPETGQYVDVPLPQPPMTPMPISPLAIGSGAAYGPTYMIYPGFMTSPPLIPTRTLVQMPQMLVQAEAEKVVPQPQQSEGMYMETPFYMSTAKAPQPPSEAPHFVGVNRTQQHPLISITSQQGPRIIAPPSFDGTTMSFVVEHR